MKKRLFMIFASIILSVGICGCANKSEDNEKEAQSTQQQKTKDMVADISSKLTVPEMIGNGSKDDVSKDQTPEDVFTYLCDIDYDKIDEFYISYASDSTAEEVFLIRLKDKSDVDMAKEELQARVERRKYQFQVYKPEEVSKFDDAKVESKGNYVLLIINSNPDAGISEFKKIVK